MTVSQKLNTQNKKKTGCGFFFLASFGALWTVLFCGVCLFAGWFVEQSLIESSSVITDFRWLNHLLYSGLILFVCGLMALLVKSPGIKKIFSLWFLAALLAVLSTPIRLLHFSAQNETAVMQIWIMLVFITGLALFGKKSAAAGVVPEKNGAALSGTMVLLICSMCLPWVLWGALGSVVDTILALGVGLTLALFSVKLVFTYYLENPGRDQGRHLTLDIVLDGFVVAVFLLIIVTALAINGSQQILVFTLPISGWLIAFFCHFWKDKKKRAKLSAGLLVGFAASLPLIFFDMDELNALITGASGETLEWAVRAAVSTFIGLFFLTLFAFSSYKIVKKAVVPAPTNISLAAIGIIGIVTAYFGWGQVGFFGDYQFIILKDQADLSSQAGITSYIDRRKSVYSELVNTALKSQTGFREKLDRMHIHFTPYYLLNSFEVNGGKLVKILLENDPSVDRILDSPHLRPLPEKPKTGQADISALSGDPLWNLSMIEADRVVKELGITGSGIIVGQTDSGVDGRHSELAAAYRGAASGDDYNWYDPWNGSPFPTDPGGHGTMTLGVVLGKDTGVAPGAQWIGCVNLARNLGNPARYLDCMQFMLAPFPQGSDPFVDGDPSQGAMIVNNSWGCPQIEGCDATVFQSVVDAMKTAGVFMSVAAGNSGDYGCSTVSDPLSIYADVFTSGSINEYGDLSGFSSIGPVIVDGSGRKKPDLVTPGENILTSNAGGGYSYVSGTSFSAPHVTGTVALMWSANPQLIGEVDATGEILISTVKAYNGSGPVCGDTNNAIGSGVLDAFEAVEAALKYSKNNP